MKRLRKKEAVPISNKLAEVYISIIEAFVMKEMEATGAKRYTCLLAK